MRTHQAALVTFGSLVTALLASAAFGDDSLKVALVAAGGITAWNAFGRHVPVAGIPMMGLAHAGVMFIPWPGQPCTLPACIVFGLAVANGALIHIRSGKRPLIDRPAAALLSALSALVIGGLWMLGRQRGMPRWPDDASPLSALWLLAPLLGFAWLVRAAARAQRDEDSLLLLQRVTGIGQANGHQIAPRQFEAPDPRCAVHGFPGLAQPFCLATEAPGARQCRKPQHQHQPLLADRDRVANRVGQGHRAKRFDWQGGRHFGGATHAWPSGNTPSNNNGLWQPIRPEGEVASPRARHSERRQRAASLQ